MESSFLERKGKREPPLFLPGTGLPAGCSPGSEGLCGSARGRPPGAPCFPPGGLRRSCVSAAGDKASSSLPQTLFFPLSGHAALRARPLPVLSTTSPHGHPGRGLGARSAPGRCSSPGQPVLPRGWEEAGRLQLLPRTGAPAVPTNDTARRGRALTTSRSGKLPGDQSIALEALRSEDAANCLQKSPV